jgi:hypothetical protein
MLDGPSRRSSIVGETYATKQEARPSGGRTFGSYSGTNGGDVGGKWKLLGMLTFVWDVLPSASLLCPRYAPSGARAAVESAPSNQQVARVPLSRYWRWWA